MADDHKKFVKEAGGDLKRVRVQLYFSSIPLSGFSIIRATHIMHLLSTSGVYTRTAHDPGDLPEDTLLEEARHLDLKLAVHHSSDKQVGSYSLYADAL